MVVSEVAVEALVVEEPPGGGDMDFRRFIRHLVDSPRAARKAFPRSTLLAIEQAIRSGEQRHDADLQFVVEGSLDISALWHGQSPRERALELFSQRRIWDTEFNSGVLVYVLLADQAVEVIADRAVHHRCGIQAWEHICRDMETRFAAGEFERGAVDGINAISRHLAHHFPPTPLHQNSSRVG